MLYIPVLLVFVYIWMVTEKAKITSLYLTIMGKKNSNFVLYFFIFFCNFTSFHLPWRPCTPLAIAHACEAKARPAECTPGTPARPGISGMTPLKYVYILIQNIHRKYIEVGQRIYSNDTSTFNSQETESKQKYNSLP